MNITLVISAITGGGAERVMVLLANYWAKEGRDVTLITLFPKDTDFYKIDPKVTRVVLDLATPSSNVLGGIMGNINRIILLRKAIKNSNPQGVISFLSTTNILTLFACYGFCVPVVVSERTDPSQLNIGRVWEKLRKLVYPMATTVVVQTHAVEGWLKRTIPKANGIVIPNPVREIPDKFDNWRGSENHKYLGAMGRLSSEKGFDMLIKSFAMLKKDYPYWSLVFIGDGPQRCELEELAKEYGLQNNVVFLGKVNEPFGVLENIDLFVLSSRREGFPNALIEAMACGLPVISFDCNSGPKDIIEHESDGLLVQDGNIEKLTQAIKRLMDDPVLCGKLGRNAQQVKDRFAIDKIMKQWTSLVDASHIVD